jgi:hypothetical protein
MTYSHLTEWIWNGIVRRFTKGDNVQGRFDRWVNWQGFESTIVSEFPSLLEEFRTSRIALLYRGTRDGFGCTDFHGKCDGHGNTITLIRTTKNFIFGGYTPLSWDSSNRDKTDSSHQSFVFTLSNPHEIGSRKFKLKPDQAQYAIQAYKGYGPVFGSGATIRVYHNCSTRNDNFTNLTGYVNDVGLDDKVVFTGEYNFTVKEIEVFEITGTHK